MHRRRVQPSHHALSRGAKPWDCAPNRAWIGSGFAILARMGSDSLTDAHQCPRCNSRFERGLEGFGASPPPIELSFSAPTAQLVLTVVPHVSKNHAVTFSPIRRRTTTNPYFGWILSPPRSFPHRLLTSVLLHGLRSPSMGTDMDMFFGDDQGFRSPEAGSRVRYHFVAHDWVNLYGYREYQAAASTASIEPGQAWEQYDGRSTSSLVADSPSTRRRPRDSQHERDGIESHSSLMPGIPKPAG